VADASSPPGIVGRTVITPQAVLLDLYEKLQEAYGGGRLPSPDDTQMLINAVRQAGRVLEELRPAETRPRRRGGPADSPPTIDPPSFPGQRR